MVTFWRIWAGRSETRWFLPVLLRAVLESRGRSVWSLCAWRNVAQWASPLGLGGCPRSLARASAQESTGAANFQLARTHDKDSLLSEQPGISTPGGVCSEKMHLGKRLHKPFQISAPGASLILVCLVDLPFPIWLLRSSDPWPFSC